MGSRALVLNAALAAIASAPVLAQANLQSTTRFGIIGGANLATFTRGMFTNPSNRTGFAAGLMAELPVLPSFAIQPELVFTTKGANETRAGYPATANVDYIEVPVLARFEIPAFSPVKPFVYGGPGFAHRVRCSFEANGGAVTCDAEDAQAQRASPGYKTNTTDVDGIIGTGLAFDVEGKRMTVSVRYDAGFVKLLNRADSKNRVLSFMGTLEWPFHR